jgi:beta-phosphoglucomutase
MELKPNAFLFDLNGTMIDDMAYHIKAWQYMLNDELKAGLSYEEVRSQMYGKNNELFVRVFGPGHFTEEQMNTLSFEKEKRYQQAFLPGLKLIKGLDAFLKTANDHGILMAIGSAALPFNIDFVLDNLPIRKYFKTIVSADDVTLSKPHPETYLKAAQQLHINPEECLVFEDAPKGVEAALNAGMPSVVITTMHGKEEFDQYPNVLFFIKDYDDVRLRGLFQ